MIKFCVFKYVDIRLRLSIKLGEKILFFILIWIFGGDFSIFLGGGIGVVWY